MSLQISIMAGIGIILNPHSRSNRKNPGRSKRLSFIVGDKGSCRETHDRSDVPQVIAEFKEKNIEILGISGGDGTLHYTLTEMLKVYGFSQLPRIALLRGGTMNNAANALKIIGSPEQILSNLICKYHSGEDFKVSQINLLNINGMYGFLFGVGTTSKVVEAYCDAPQESSVWLAVQIAFKLGYSCLLNTKWGYKICERLDANVLVDGREWPFKNYSTIAAGSVETFGFGFNPFYRTRSEPGKFQVIAMSMQPREMLLKSLNSFISRPIKSENSLDEVAQKVEMTFKEPQRYTIDGELFGPANQITVETGPSISVVVG